MGHLPNEIIAHIISHLAPKRYSDGSYAIGSRAHDFPALAPYATVSRAWQQRVEATTFEYITLTPARLASPLAAQALTPDRVRRFVRSVRVEVLLPPYDEQARGRLEDEADRARNDGVFTDVMRMVFRLLAVATATESEEDDGYKAHAGVDAEYRPKIRLSLSARCTSDTEDLEARKYRRSVYATRPNDLFERRYESSYLDLRPAAGKSVQDEAKALPELHCIQQFHVQASAGPDVRYFAPRALCLVASRMSGLERMQWQLCDNEKRDVALRRKLRADFAHALQTLPSSLRHFDLLYDRRPQLDHSFQTPSILDETDHDNNDKLSLALHQLTQRLATFELMADVGPEILWPLQANDSLWPTMCHYYIDPGPIAPSGKWRFQLLPDSDSDSDDDGSTSSVSSSAAPGNEKEDPFRAKLDPDAAHALLLAAARAARRMPALRKMELMLDPPIWRGNKRLEVVYTAMAGTARGGTPVAPLGGGGATAELLVEVLPCVLPGRRGCASLEGGRGGTFGRRVRTRGGGQGVYGVVTVSGVDMPVERS
jgi:hypothetical protein